MEPYSEKLSRRMYKGQNFIWGCLIIMLLIFLIFTYSLMGIFSH